MTTRLEIWIQSMVNYSDPGTKRAWMDGRPDICAQRPPYSALGQPHTDQGVRLNQFFFNGSQNLERISWRDSDPKGDLHPARTEFQTTVPTLITICQGQDRVSIDVGGIRKANEI